MHSKEAKTSVEINFILLLLKKIDIVLKTISITVNSISIFFSKVQIQFLENRAHVTGRP